ncbi:hypothetical protein OROMI_014005 [Orobanche minor]
MATPATEEVVRKKPEADQPPLAAVMDMPPVAPPPHEDTKALSKWCYGQEMGEERVEEIGVKSQIYPYYTSQVPAEPVARKGSKGSLDRDVALAKLEDDKKYSFIKAWEESEKTKVENKAQKKLCEVSAWENSQKASLESQLKRIEEQLEKKKAEYGERMKNKVALVHKQAEEKRAVVEARRGEDMLKAEELAARYRAKGGRYVPKKAFGCFGC